MRTRSLLLVAGLAAQSTVTAQEAITLEVRLFHDEALVASPTVTSREGEAGAVRLDDRFDFTLTPMRLDNQHVRVSLVIRDGARTLRPRMLISRDTTGTVRWVHHAGDEHPAPIVEIRVALGRGRSSHSW